MSHALRVNVCAHSPWSRSRQKSGRFQKRTKFADNTEQTILKLRITSFLKNEAAITTFTTTSSISAMSLYHCINNEHRPLFLDVTGVNIVNQQRVP